MPPSDLLRTAADLADVPVDDVHDAYFRRSLDQWSDRRLAAAVAEVVAVPKEAPADSFVLHAPLELLARVGLLPAVRPEAREGPASGWCGWRRPTPPPGRPWTALLPSGAGAGGGGRPPRPRPGRGRPRRRGPVRRGPGPPRPPPASCAASWPSPWPPPWRPPPTAASSCTSCPACAPRSERHRHRPAGPGPGAGPPARVAPPVVRGPDEPRRRHGAGRAPSSTSPLLGLTGQRLHLPDHEPAPRRAAWPPSCSRPAAWCPPRRGAARRDLARVAACVDARGADPTTPPTAGATA